MFCVEDHPVNLKVTWSSSQFEYRRYTTELPLQISVGSTLHCWPQITAKDPISYENNVAAGTASVLLHGTGLFTGTKKITFTIQQKQTTAHTHQPVIDDAIPTTCNATGMTEGSHCSLGGETLLASTETDALTHSYVNGICESVISFYPTTAPFLGEDVWQNINSALTLEAPTYATGT